MDSPAVMESMPISSVGRASNLPRAQARGWNRGVTLIEMLMVVTLIGLMVGISFPALNSGLDTIRLMSATDAVVSFLNSALNRAERRQQVLEVTISRTENKLSMQSTEPGFLREIEMPTGVTITRILPELPLGADDKAPRRILLYPGGTVPRVGVELENRRGRKRIVRIDPVSGVPDIETPQPVE